MMIDVQAREISEKDLAAALRLAHPEVCLTTLLDFFSTLQYHMESCIFVYTGC